MPQVKPEIETFAKIKVIGVGGGGNHALSRMVVSKIQGVEFVAVNADAQDLHHCQAPQKLLIGKNLTKGLGAGMNPDIGRQAAEENRDEIQEVVKGADLVFVTYGLGGGVGTGAGPVVAEAAKDAGALTVAVVTRPFSFEGRQRAGIADEGLNYLRDKVDALITIPNDKLLHIIDKNTSLLDAFKIVDDVLRQGVQGISDLIVKPGMVNVDFADVRAIMQEAGSALMGIGRASGDDRAVEAAKAAINSPLLEVSIDGAKGVLFNVSGGGDLSMIEINEAAKVITESIDPDAKVIFGAVTDDKIKKGEIKVTVIATGFSSDDFGGEAEINFSRPPVLEKEDEEKDARQEDKKRAEKRVPARRASENKESAAADKESEWDIPAFIRKKISK
ncbi:MAG: cell division protein FtsZ [Candidatus Portnoybacteria bacterium CG10_big_fil_rev_8_21_14_0_10_44_7]|uniref:Cell division protein FtsZ n=1 Tax=Candidatus Portnoybacteria bacterium CG10_big_fil_rev_8_21_14_0_10_44_7 TaxID=1974816 RepID=A0A2M8KIS8_9BACT|nr:MAG: cell division protein FtsZ [Candidatus Portnoybacteria bacterium CG10_big_fil_rev_8_21_14_0_10_44_7]